jgi:hypothetical protein
VLERAASEAGDGEPEAPRLTSIPEDPPFAQRAARVACAAFERGAAIFGATAIVGHRHRLASALDVSPICGSSPVAAGAPLRSLASVG